jgi:dihydroorotase
MLVRCDARGTPVSVIMRKPADMHQHPRRGAMLKRVAPLIGRRFAWFIVMPNPLPPITTARMAYEYFLEIEQEGLWQSTPMMTLYLTDSLAPKELEWRFEGHRIAGVKYYPRGLTTNSENGVANPSALWDKSSNAYAVCRTVADLDQVFLIHAADGFDASGNELDPFEQEPHFIRETLPRIIEAHPNLKISVEHLSTKVGADFIERNGGTKLRAVVYR